MCKIFICPPVPNLFAGTGNETSNNMRLLTNNIAYEGAPTPQIRCM